jgi:thiosulfate/3-mercaptopyruvate sulfurtransferase
VPQNAHAAIVETDWLAERLGTPGMIVFDGTWHLPTSGRDAKAEYLAGHIPGALFFDIDDLRDETSSLPHMLPSTIKFASRMKKMGVGDGMKIIVYDTLGLFSAARVWWTFRAMGHKDVSVLNGGLKKWTAEGRQLEDGLPVARTSRHFSPLQNSELIRDLDDMKSYVEKKNMQIVDARPAARFEGTEAEPRPGLRAGHIPGSKNIPSALVVNADGTLKSKAELEALFKNTGIDPAKPVVTTCGSGVTAAVLSLALAVAGQSNAAVYDGAWAEWGQATGDHANLSVETGPAR